jgi:2Fe-2S ferredoxin
MPAITFMPMNMTVEVKSGTNLMQAAIDAGLPVGSSCGRVGICAKCQMLVLDGMPNLSLPNATEKELQRRDQLAADIRISCQTKILGNAIVKTTYW